MQAGVQRRRSRDAYASFSKRGMEDWPWRVRQAIKVIYATAGVVYDDNVKQTLHDTRQFAARWRRALICVSDHVFALRDQYEVTGQPEKDAEPARLERLGLALLATERTWDGMGIDHASWVIESARAAVDSWNEFVNESRQQI
jgi:hypothetical protein